MAAKTNSVNAAQQQVEQLAAVKRAELERQQAAANLLPELERQQAAAGAELKAAKEAERAAALIPLRAAEIAHERAVLKAAEALAVEVTQLWETSNKIRAIDGTPHDRIIGPILNMPKMMETQRKELAKTHYAGQPAIEGV